MKFPHKEPEKKFPRNEPCPCGSGIKYKKCCEAKKREPKKFGAQVMFPGDAGATHKLALDTLFQQPAVSQPEEPTGNS
jgi:hypothetical protein